MSLFKFLSTTSMGVDGTAMAMRTLSYLQWPEVHAGEFIKTSINDNPRGVVLFHPHCGIVARITSNLLVEEHPLVLPRIRTFKLGGSAYLEICPGINLSPGVTLAEAEWVNNKLYSSHISNHDGIPDAFEPDILTARVENFGRYPFRTSEHPAGLPVLLDRDLLTLHRGSKPAGKLLTDYGVASNDAHAYLSGINHLRRILASGWPVDSQKPNIGVMAKFWQAAQNLTAQSADALGPERILYQGWKSPGKLVEHVRDSKAERASIIWSLQQRRSNSGKVVQAFGHVADMTKIGYLTIRDYFCRPNHF